jgi:hypothetical protein
MVTQTPPAVATIVQTQILRAKGAVRPPVQPPARPPAHPPAHPPVHPQVLAQTDTLSATVIATQATRFTVHLDATVQTTSHCRRVSKRNVVAGNMASTLGARRQGRRRRRVQHVATRQLLGHRLHQETFTSLERTNDVSRGTATRIFVTTPSQITQRDARDD